MRSPRCRRRPAQSWCCGTGKTSASNRWPLCSAAHPETSRARAPARWTNCAPCSAAPSRPLIRAPPRQASGPRPEAPVMDESSLRDLLRTATEPEPPIGQLASNSLRAGVILRRRRLTLGAAVAAAAVAAISLVAATLGGTPGRPPATVPATAEPAAGPSAGQLAHGHWVRMPPAPLKMCGNLALWDGRGLLVIQEPADACPPGAAEYDPRANRWTAIAAPPILKHQWAVAASGGGRVVLVLNTGATYSWQPTTSRWQRLGTLPAGENHFSVIWTGRTFLVTRLYRWRQPGPGQVFKLTGRRWTPMPDLPPPPTGQMQEAPAVVHHGAVYVLAHIV